MIRVYLTGGFGNQLFQFATAYAAAKKSGTTLGLDLTWFQAVKGMPGVTVRNFDLGYIDSSLYEKIEPKPFVARILMKKNFALAEVVNRTRGCTFIRELDPFSVDTRLQKANDNVTLLGVFQSEKYFEHYKGELKSIFKTRSTEKSGFLELRKSMNTSGSVCVHVRRGDFLSNSQANQVHGLPDLNYYENAVQKLSEKFSNLHFYIFSDDQDWVKEQNIWPQRVTFVDDRGHEPPEIVNLMSECEHHILSNSTFGWWAAWLKDRQGDVILPKYWLRNRETETTSLKCHNWEIL